MHWQPPAGATPAQGNYIYLESEAGEAIGQGKSYLYTEVESTLSVSSLDLQLQFDVGNTDKQWSGTVATPFHETGFYGDIGNVGVGPAGLRWAVEGRECEVVQGWFVIDVLVGLDAIDLRFVQRCAGSSRVLRGKVRWYRADARDGPIMPVPPQLWQPPASANVPTDKSYVYIESAPGDYVGRGKTRLFTLDDAALDLLFIQDFSVEFYSVVARTSDESWAGNFLIGQGFKLRAGYYPGVQRHPFADTAIGGMEWIHDGRGCGRVNGWFVIDDIVYVGDSIDRIEMRFEQRCDQTQETLRAKIRLLASDFAPPSGPVTPPSTLWQPPAGATPATGDYVYLESEAGDSVGLGQARAFTADNAALSGTPYLNSFHIHVDGDSHWVGQFTTMKALKWLVPGHYADLQKMPLHDPAKGGLLWLNDGRACDAATGWTAIDTVDLAADGSVALLEMRFEQRCSGDSGSLRGKLRWTAPQSATATRTSIPPLLWQPSTGATPASGNYFYIESDYGDPRANGDARLYTHDNALLVASAQLSPGIAPVIAVEARNQRDNFAARLTAAPAFGRLQSGFYGNLRGVPSSLSVGALEASGRATGCGQAGDGWYAVDSVTYNGDELASVELRFENVCDGYSASLRGKMRWSASDTALPPGPKAAPAGLWAPPLGATPTTGNYLYVESEYGDDMGQGKTRLLRENFVGHGWDNLFNQFDFEVNPLASPDHWRGSFNTMVGVPTIQPGFYDDTSRAPFHNPTRGGLEVINPSAWFCNTISGWYMVDSVNYTNGILSAIEVRFEQHCDGRSAALRGKVHWTAAQ